MAEHGAAVLGGIAALITAVIGALTYCDSRKDKATLATVQGVAPAKDTISVTTNTDTLARSKEASSRQQEIVNPPSPTVPAAEMPQATPNDTDATGETRNHEASTSRPRYFVKVTEGPNCESLSDNAAKMNAKRALENELAPFTFTHRVFASNSTWCAITIGGGTYEEAVTQKQDWDNLKRDGWGRGEVIEESRFQPR